MRKGDNTDIYQYQFDSLFSVAKSLIGRSPICTDSDDYEETQSYLLFDVSGVDFNRFKSYEAEYHYWVEVYILKIIMNLLNRYGIAFQENYYSDQNEQHSLTLYFDGKVTETYFLFDIFSEEPNCTDYDKIGSILKARSTNVEEIKIFIFRSHISYSTLANLINGDKKMSENGFVNVLTLQNFFDTMFDEHEYQLFAKYSNDFTNKCNNIISYKTIISPTPDTIKVFKQRKSNMLRDLDYKKIQSMGKSGQLSDIQFETVHESFIEEKLYDAMLSDNDFADSFISAEWSYDVYSSAMGDLDLTGIIAGYLKSIEQLLYTIARFHRDEGYEISTRKGKLEYTKDNEDIIDSTLDSLNNFVTSPKAKLARSGAVRGCIHYAVNLWRKYQRNGYFHKHNLYKKDNKIDEVRDLTIFLYFIILGGIEFTNQEKESLGIRHEQNENGYSYNKSVELPKFERWISELYTYDIPSQIPGLCVLLIQSEQYWEFVPYILKTFNINDYETGHWQFDPSFIDLNHTKHLRSFKLPKETTDDSIEVSLRFQDLFDQVIKGSTVDTEKLGAIIIEFEKITQLIYYPNTSIPAQPV